MKEEFFDFDLYEIPESSTLDLQKDNKDSVMIFVYEHDIEAHKSLLDKIISAIGLDENFGNIIKLTKGDQLNASSISTDKIKYLISFGIAPAKLGFNATFRGYHTYQTETFKVLLSHSLQKLSSSVEHKKALWAQLQKEFS